MDTERGLAKPALLIVDDDETYLNSLQRALRGNYEVRAARSPAEAMALLSPPPEAVLLDLRLSAESSESQSSLRLLKSLRKQLPDVPVLMITAYGDIEVVVKCMQLGAADFLQKPRADIREIKARLTKAVEHGKLSRRFSQLEQELRLKEPRLIVGNSKEIGELKRIIEAVASDAKLTVLIRGETGTGKELVARAIHASGKRRAEAFVPVMLNAIPQSMIEPELFGSEAGAFTDARERRIGYLEQAHGGVLFLDEIGEVDANTQIKLLRFLEEREFCRLGGRNTIKVDVQVIAATNADLKQRVSEGRFREDLYFRLRVHEIILPTLRERRADIVTTIEYFLDMFHRGGKKLFRVTPAALDVLTRFDWPGNVRQLRNTIESAIFMADLHGHINIEPSDLPADVLAQEATNLSLLDIQETLARTELQYIERTLAATGERKQDAWQLLGYNDRFALRRRVKRILKSYPQLVEQFPLVKKNFAKAV